MEKNIKSPIQQEDIIEAQIEELEPNAYVIRERIDTCKMCGSQEDLRFGWCWDCAEAQNILATGRGMFEDEDGKEEEVPIKLVNERLKKLLDIGWRKTKETEFTTKEGVLTPVEEVTDKVK